MRRPPALRRSGLVAVAAALLLTACGGSGDDGQDAAADATTTATTTSAPETTRSSAPQADSAFCTEAAGIQQRVVAGLTGPDQTGLAGIFQTVAEEIRATDPPAELADDWSTFADGIDQLAAASQIDFEDKDAYAQWQQQVIALQAEFGPAFTAVQNYLATQCGLTDGEPESASPTS